MGGFGIDRYIINALSVSCLRELKYYAVTCHATLLPVTTCRQLSIREGCNVFAHNFSRNQSFFPVEIKITIRSI